jgi:hypothetical protein
MPDHWIQEIYKPRHESPSFAQDPTTTLYNVAGEIRSLSPRLRERTGESGREADIKGAMGDLLTCDKLVLPSRGGWAAERPLSCGIHAGQRAHFVRAVPDHEEDAVPHAAQHNCGSCKSPDRFWDRAPRTRQSEPRGSGALRRKGRRPADFARPAARGPLVAAAAASPRDHSRRSPAAQRVHAGWWVRLPGLVGTRHLAVWRVH